MRSPILLLAVAVSALVACSDAAGGSDAGLEPVTELPDGAPCPTGTQFCGGAVCVSLTDFRNCGGCGVRCPASAPTCTQHVGGYACSP